MKQIDIYDFDKTIVPFDSGSLFWGIFNASLPMDNFISSISGSFGIAYDYESNRFYNI